MNNNKSSDKKSNDMELSNRIIHNEEKVEIDPFLEIMEQVGNHGRFQLIYNSIFLLVLSGCGAMVFMNIILALNIPDHWCTVPGRENSNYTLDQWRQLTLPTQKDNRGTEKYSSCEMYNVNFEQIVDWNSWNTTKHQANVTACQAGWSYDETWYDSTIPTKENWVCDKDLYVTNSFVVSRATEVIGSFVLGQMGDYYGRRFVYYISMILTCVFRILSILTTDSYYVFLACTGIVGFSVNSLFQSPQVIGMEICREQDRSTNAIMQSFGWSFGSCLMPMIFWWSRDWYIFMWATSAPIALFVIVNGYLIESPRWLINKKRFGDAIVQFRKIAKINGRSFDLTEKELKEKFNKTATETTFGIASLFNGWRLARNTCIMGFSWCVVAVSYFTIVLFSAQMGGNPFLNFLLQTMGEIPSYMIAKFLGDRLGRRFTNTSSFFLSFLMCMPIFYFSSDIRYQWLMTTLLTTIKCLNALTFFTASLQGMEIYPTCMRQSGLALGTILANVVGIAAPYLVYMGTNQDIKSPFYILCTLFFLGSIAAFFLPETLHKKLPDTMEEARNFGIHDSWFSLPKAPPKRIHTEDKEKLNQMQYAP